MEEQNEYLRAIVVWSLTFIPLITILFHRNITSEQVREKIEKREQVGTTSLTLASLLLPFILGRFSMLLSTDNFISIITALPTVFIAYLAWKGYNKIIANKLSEKQLDQVLNLLIKINSYKFPMTFIFSQGVVPVNVKKNVSLMELAESHNIEGDNVPNSIIDIFEKKYRYINFDYQHIFISREFLESIISIYEYNTDVLIPKEIAVKLRNFSSSNFETLEGVKNHFDIRIENDELVWDATTSYGFMKDNREKLYPYVKIGDGYLPISIMLRYVPEKNKTYKSPLNSWYNLRKELNELVKSIHDWLKYNNIENIENINIPELTIK